MRRENQDSRNMNLAMEEKGVFFFFSYNKGYAFGDCVICVGREGGTCCNGVMSIVHYLCGLLPFSFEEDEWLFTRYANLLPSTMEETEPFFNFLLKIWQKKGEIMSFLHLYVPFLMLMQVHCLLLEGTESIAA